nr:4Fe-4S dicluster domain-containing protein [uncultured Holophaga sp.]
MNRGNAVLVDLTRCIGCGSCTVACKLWNGRPFEKAAPATGPHPVANDSNWTTLAQRRVLKEGEPAWRFVKRQCMHCVEPACVASCFAKAMRKTEEGPVIYRPDLCAGCRYCMVACPFEVPTYEWEKVIPSVSKCQMCSTRLAAGRSPACTETCPTGALRFGQRETLLMEARERLRTGNYVKHIYGEKEAGGTSWLYLSDIPFRGLGFRTDVVQEPLPEITEHYIRRTPALLLGSAALFMGLSRFLDRKRKVSEREEKHD